MSLEVRVHSAKAGPPGSLAGRADPITTEVIRQGVNSAAEQMKRVLIRTAFTQMVYEMLDFAVGIYDRQIRLLGQAPSMPIFMGTLSFCIEAAVAAVGGEDALEDGDILLYNYPYETGTHTQDVVLVCPVFVRGKLVGYSAVKAHWLDLGGKDPYSTDTSDVFQEGMIFPGVKLYRRGVLVEDIFRLVIANTRLPSLVAGDILAEVSCIHAGRAGLEAIVERYGFDVFDACIERMFDHGETVVRDYLADIPDGTYVGHGEMDNNGVDDEVIPFEVTVDVSGSTVRVDFSSAPEQQPGPANSPYPGTVCATRIALTLLAGGGETPNEGHFRPIEVVTRPGTLFHPLPPAPCYVYYWASVQAIEAVLHAISKALPERVPACSGGDVLALISWGTRESTGVAWADGLTHVIGQGGHRGGDGVSAVFHHSGSSTQIVPTEVWETKNPWMVERMELRTDSCGAGTFRGGLGVEVSYTATEDLFVTSTVDRTKNAPWALEGGTDGVANAAALRSPDGTRRWFHKATAMKVPKGATVEVFSGGGGGYGSPLQRDPESVRSDLRAGYITEEYARRHHPHVFADDAPAASPTPSLDRSRR